MGGIVIEYKTTTFLEPSPISELQYNQIKEALIKDEHIKIYKQENTGDMYDTYYWTLGIAAVLLILCFVFSYFFGESSIVIWIGLFAGIAFFGGLYKFHLESSSFLNYEKIRDEYFLRMKFTIIKSQSFSEFNKYFYTIFSKHFDDDYIHWKKMYFTRQT